MRTDTAPSPTLLKDYTPPNFAIDATELDFNLHPENTQVKATLKIRRLAAGVLALDGENINLISVAIDSHILARKDYRLTQTQLIILKAPDAFTLTIKTTCNPTQNTALMGLYISGGRFCTQCEAEGFRRITYFMDRPDVLSTYRVKMIAQKDRYPYLLANGNKIETGNLPDGRHFAIWEDPFPKPCYLFALVAGGFDILEDSFETMSGRIIPLTIYVDPGNASKAEFAMDALKRSMRWDETAFGREYDLDRFMIVAVRDFNFGAMENKGLNIFNSSLLLADGKSATDLNFERIESVVAHEYFHNWTGNRITCRDWFQLCLKEGFTVFRDQEFSADERGASVQRIKDVRALRGRQFPEDNGPLAHAVRPDSYIKIDNFYTATIYEKGAELIRMLKTLMGPKTFRQACDLYFNTLDGTAATIEQFIECFETASGQDLSQFMRWYTDAGTPRITVEKKRTQDGFDIKFSQFTPPTPNQSEKPARIIPILWQAFGETGSENDPQLTILQTLSETVSFKTSQTDISLSLLQDFSAPVILRSSQTEADLLRLMRLDTNAFNRWEAGQIMARDLMGTMSQFIQSGKTPPKRRALEQFTTALKITLNDPDLDDAFKALALTLPTRMEIQQSIKPTDPMAVSGASHWLARAMGDHLADDLLEAYHNRNTISDFNPSPDAAGRRSLKNQALALLAISKHTQTAPLAIEQINSANNMTDELSALSALIRLGGKRLDQMIDNFYRKWEDNPLVIDKWFMLQASRPHIEGITALQTLTEHPAYDLNNPNRVRSLLGSFSMNNPDVFHKFDGSGYSFFSNQVLTIDNYNPQIAARLLGAYNIWPKLDGQRQNLITKQLTRIIRAKPSKNTREIAEKTLNS